MTIITVLPFTTIINTPDLVIQTHRAADPSAHILTVLDAIPQQPHTICTSVPAHAVVQDAKVEPMLKRAVLNELALGDLFVVVDQAVCEAEVQLRIGVFAGCAKEDNVAKTFGLAVFALDAIVFIGESAGCCEYAMKYFLKLRRSYRPIKDSLKSTFSEILAIVGTTSF